MSSIPPGQPYSATPATGNAAQKVNGPAIGLMITAGVGAAFQVIVLLLNILNAGAGAATGGQEGMITMLSGGVGIVFNIIGLIVAVVVFLGAMKMKALQSYNFAMAASILAMIPCVSPCCLAGLPIGIWAIVMLVKPEVKAAFR